MAALWPEERRGQEDDVNGIHESAGGLLPNCICWVSAPWGIISGKLFHAPRFL